MKVHAFIGFLLAYHLYVPSVDCASLRRDVRSPDAKDAARNDTVEAANTTPQTATPLNVSTSSDVDNKTGRSLNIDVEKYVSPEFHNKNNVYVLPTSPEIREYVNPEFTSEAGYSASSLALGDFLDSKFQLVADSIKQNLEEIEHLKHHDDEEVDVPTLIDRANAPGNDTKISLKVAETKTLERSIEKEKNATRGDEVLQAGRNVDFKATSFKTDSYDEQRTEKYTEPPVETTVKKIVTKERIQVTEPSTVLTKSTKKPIERLPGLKNATDPPKNKASRQFENNLVSQVTKPTTDSTSKRGSTKYVDSLAKSTTPVLARQDDIDDKGFSIPTTATAWSLASLKDVPTSKSPDAIVQENNVVKITVAPPSTTVAVSSNTDVITTESPPKTTPTVFSTSTERTTTQTIESSTNHTEKPIEKLESRNENEIYKSSEEVSDPASTTTATPLKTKNDSVVQVKSTTMTYSTVIDRSNISNVAIDTSTSTPTTTAVSNEKTTVVVETTTPAVTKTENNEPTTVVGTTTTIPDISTVTEQSNVVLESRTSNASVETTENTSFPLDTTTRMDYHMVTTMNSTEEGRVNGTGFEDVMENEDFEDVDMDRINEEKQSGPKKPADAPVLTKVTFESTTERIVVTFSTETSSTTEEQKSTSVKPTRSTSSTTKSPVSISTSEATVPPTRKFLEPKVTRTSVSTDVDTSIEENNTTSTDPTNATGMLGHDDDDDDSNPGMVAAIAISSVGAACLVLLAGLLIIMRKRQKRVTYGQRCRPVSLDAYSLDNVSVYNSVRRGKAAIRASKRSYGNPAFDDPVSVAHQMNFQALAKFNDNPDGISAEFDQVPQVTARANEIPPGCETKNRYANVIPLPETRVFLSASDNDPLSDYINANYVTGPKNSRGYYIACQAPMDNTIDDFWRMVWEQQSRVVLMLTNLYENGVEKCADYLPPSEVLDCHRLFGDFQITLKKRDVKDKYVISSLQLKNMVSNSWREVTHLWYLGWPERGVPAEANSLIAFLIEARGHLKAASNNNDGSAGASKVDGGPVVVHCSPGTGRTGTVIACDVAIRDFELTRNVDVPTIVYRVRRDRASAVQTKDQYAFIYKLITLYATKLTGGALDSI